MFLAFVLLLPSAALAKSGTEVYQAPAEDIAKIKEEGMNNSKVMETLSYLTDVIGGRLTNSPNMKRANEWTRDTMAGWGMKNAALEAWGPFGRGWSLKSFSANVDCTAGFSCNCVSESLVTEHTGCRNRQGRYSRC